MASTFTCDVYVKRHTCAWRLTGPPQKIIEWLISGLLIPAPVIEWPSRKLFLIQLIDITAIVEFLDEAQIGKVIATPEII